MGLALWCQEAQYDLFFEAGCSRHDLLPFAPFRALIGQVVVAVDFFRMMIFLTSPSKSKFRDAGESLTLAR